MPFRLRKDARHWFRDVSNAFSVDFDMYYLCLMAGLAKRRKADVGSNEATDLTDAFPREYRAQSAAILALFLSRELKQLGIRFSERAALHTAIRRLVEPRSPAGLSDEGVREMNRYAHGGFEVLTEWFEERPRHIEEFLCFYKGYLAEAAMPSAATDVSSSLLL